MPYQTGGRRRAWIALDRLQFSAETWSDAWGRAAPQPCSLSAQVECNIGVAAEQDLYADTLDYSKLAKELRGAADQSLGKSADAFSAALAEIAAAHKEQIVQMRIRLELPGALLNSRAGLALDFSLQGAYTVELKGISVPCIIGIKDRERRAKQTLVVGARLMISTPDAKGQRLPRAWMQDLTQMIFERISVSTFQTAEAAADAVASIVESYFVESIHGELIERATLLSVSVRKPSAISGVDGSGVTFSYGQETLSFDA